MRSLRQRRPDSPITNANTVNANWNGSGYVLLVDQNVVMPQAANGTMIFGWVNQATMNNAGTLSITSGGSAPTFLSAPALLAQPGVLIHNWMANNLSVTNISPNQQTPIWISAYGPGTPGQTSMPLRPDSKPVALATGQSAQGKALPQNMQLAMQSATPTLCIFGIIGGPSDATGNNGYAIAVNALANTGPGTGVAPPDGYYATTTDNGYYFTFNWGSSTVYVVNLSPATASGAQVLLRPL
jgi:hypothetical protein